MKLLKNQTMMKILITGGISLLLLIPLNMLMDLVSERETRRTEAVMEVSGKWGSEQTVIGPLLIVPYYYHYLDKKKILRVSIKNAYFLPETLSINGSVEPEKRSRGLYEVVLYRAKELSFSGYFNRPDFSKLNISNSDILWDDAYLAVAITDTRGIQKEIKLKWNNREIPFIPGVKNTPNISSGIHAVIKGLGSQGNKISYNFSVDLQGSSSLHFSPMGKETIAGLSSVWPHPSFEGAYLPANHTVSEDGFKAHWKVSYFGRNFSQEWTDDNFPDMSMFSNQTFGVSMYLPVDFYQKSMRAVKYGFLFITLTFLVFFLFEIFMKLRIHPLQYLMVGFAMCIFYLLFLSLSEHVGFLPSYLISSVSVIGLITAYSMKILGVHLRGGIVMGLLLALYSYLFILLQNQDYALLLGALALFIILAAVMYITRNIDWYTINDEQSRSYNARA